ncbi:MAG: hypothetical protein CMJ46_09515 [Planctomyces sp.]|nr:hypothetical protein [Planctomyces sp.]
MQEKRESGSLEVSFGRGASADSGENRTAKLQFRGKERANRPWRQCVPGEETGPLIPGANPRCRANLPLCGQNGIC